MVGNPLAASFRTYRLYGDIARTAHFNICTRTSKHLQVWVLEEGSLSFQFGKEAEQLLLCDIPSQQNTWEEAGSPATFSPDS